MKKVYVDNSSTSFPKAPGMADAVKRFFDGTGANINRGGYESSYSTAQEVYKCRKLLSGFFNAASARNIIFTPGITYSLNMLLKGFLKPGDHVVTTSMEHNGLMRPLHDLSLAGVEYSVANCNPDGTLDPLAVQALFKPSTKLVVMTHASNVCGTVFPVYDITKICKARGIHIIIDSAQTAGVLPIDASFFDAVAFTAHKGLLGAQGLGGFVISDEFAQRIDPIITGGTGSASHELAQPSFLPDKFEPGTLNIPAIIGLKASLEYINQVGMSVIYEKEIDLAKRFVTGVQKLSGVQVVGSLDWSQKIAVISLNFANLDNAEAAGLLDTQFGIMTRCGLHCSAISHKTLSTYPSGTVRFSFGHFNTYEEIDYIINAIKAVLNLVVDKVATNRP